MTQMTPASNVPQRAYIDALNDAYADYFVPMFISVPFFEQLVEHESIDLDRSVAATSGDIVVGTCLLGIRDRVGWIGGMGVLPAYRKQGIARHMMHYLIEQSREAGLDSLILEVITANEAAIHLYESLGFETVRTLNIMVYDGQNIPEPVSGYEAEFANSGYDAIHFTHLPSAPLPWQRQAYDRFKTMPVLTLRKNDVIAGFCIYEQQGGAITIMHAAASDEEAGHALLAALQNHHQNYRMTYLNVGDDDPLLSTLDKSGFVVGITQYEMLLELK